jgi:hypothetical protein
MVMIHFLGVGAQKSGTTTLHDLLKQHYEINLPVIKETKFFCEDKKFETGLEFYLSHFNTKNTGASIWGEIDPDYMYNERAPERIYNTLGRNIKLIFLLRNPVDRAYSHYLMNRKRYIEDKSFTEALLLENERLKKGEYNKLNFSYLARGYYGKQIKEFLKYFPSDQMLILIFENFIRQKEKYLYEILQFIGVKNTDFKFNTAIKSNPAFVPRIHLLNMIIYRDTILNKWAKIIIKDKQRRRVIRYNTRLLLEKINNRKIKQTELVPEIRNKLSRLFDRDIKDLQLLTGLNFDIWDKSSFKT